MIGGSNAGVAYVELRAKLDQFERDLKQAESSALKGGTAIGTKVDTGVRSKLKGLGDFGKKIGKALAVGAGAALAGVAVAGKFALEAAQEAAEVGAQTEAVLKSTGGAANITAEEIGNLATKISLYSAIEDDAIKVGQNMLLTFTNIRNEVGEGNDIFTQASERLVDMSVGMGTDMKSSAIQLGKALNDPVKGVTALGRAGVQFTDKQKKTIEAFIDSNQRMKAQKVILRELTEQFGGSARKVGNTKSWDKMKNAIGEVMESIGTALLPTVNDLANRLSRFVQSEKFRDWLEKAEVWLKKKLPEAIEKAKRWLDNDLKPALQNVADALRPVVGFLGDVFRLMGKIAERAGGFANILKNIIPAVGAVDLFGGGDSGGGFGPTVGLTAVGQRLQGGGFSVTGHPSFPPIGRHTPGSYHYSGRAIDVNWPGPGETEKLNALAGAMKLSLGNRIKELFYPGYDPVGGHDKHLHLAMDTGGWVKGPATVHVGNIRERVHFTPERQRGGVVNMTFNISADSMTNGKKLVGLIRSEIQGALKAEYHWQARMDGARGWHLAS